MLSTAKKISILIIKKKKIPQSKLCVCMYSACACDFLPLK